MDDVQPVVSDNVPALPPHGAGYPNPRKVEQIINLAIWNPDWSQRRIAQEVGIASPNVCVVLKSAYARQRIDSAYDVRPVVRQALQAGVVDSLGLHRDVVVRARRELRLRKPNDTVLQTGVRAATETLKGTKVYSGDAVGVSVRLEGADAFKGLADLLADPSIRAAIEGQRGNTPTPGSGAAGEAHAPSDRA